MSEEQTFRKLRQIPFEEMEDLLKSIPQSPPVFSLGSMVFESRKPEIVRHYEQLRALDKHGWAFEEFILESEKRNIMKAIAIHNAENAFPIDLVNRAKEFFPNARFIQARIELE
jgi:hypothetical protein